MTQNSLEYEFNKPMPSSTDTVLVKIEASQVNQLFSGEGHDTIVSISSPEDNPFPAFQISKANSRTSRQTLNSFRVSGRNNVPIGLSDSTIFMIDSQSLHISVVIRVISDKFNKLEGTLPIHSIPLSRKWIHERVLLKNDKTEVGIDLEISLFPTKVLIEQLPFQQGTTCKGDRFPNCDHCSFLWLMYEDSPFKQAEKCEHDLILIPRSGNFLSDFNGSSELHIGILCAGKIKEYNQSGMNTVNSSGSIWNECLPLKIFDEVISVELTRQDLYAKWIKLFDELPVDDTSQATDDSRQWTVSTYESEDNNCFDFAVEFLHQFNDATDGCLGFNGRLTKLQFCKRFVLPRTKGAARYIDIYRRIWNNK